MILNRTGFFITGISRSLPIIRPCSDRRPGSRWNHIHHFFFLSCMWLLSDRFSGEGTELVRRWRLWPNNLRFREDRPVCPSRFSRWTVRLISRLEKVTTKRRHTRTQNQRLGGFCDRIMCQILRQIQHRDPIASSGPTRRFIQRYIHNKTKMN